MLKSLKKVMVGMLGATFLISALAPVSAAPTCFLLRLWPMKICNRSAIIAGVVATGIGAGIVRVIVPAGRAVPVTGMAIAVIVITAMAIAATAMAGGIRWQLSEPVRSLAALLLPRHRRRLPFIRRQPIVTATPIFSGAITAISPTGLRTTRSSLIMAPASSAIRPTD
ncbi:hypothetical protein C961_02522 [Brucella ovis F8/05B]|nr:hypothetical protein C961_02522 [Brucella ovis F8/05B]